jgi:hypothetical protein
MKRLPILVVAVALLASVCMSRTDDLAEAQTTSYCQLIENSRAFDGKLVRVRALYETDFEKMTLTAPACASPLPMTWVTFESAWESRTAWRLRRAMIAARSRWNVQTDVVLIGRFKSGVSFGHNGMYPFLLQVYKVEALKPSGSFSPLPGEEKKK